MREECEDTSTQSPPCFTHTRVKRKRPLHGFPSETADCTLTPFTTAVVPYSRMRTSWLRIGPLTRLRERSYAR